MTEAGNASRAGSNGTGAMAKGPEGDAAGALRGGEAQRGDPSAAPRPLGRKDPTTTGESAPDKENVRIRD